MRAFVTGATGFVGQRLVERLVRRGDQVVALVRTPEKAGRLRDLECEIVEGDLSSDDAIGRGVQGADSVFHVGADYRVGIPKRERPALDEANVRGTERVLDAATAAGASRIVHVSTGNVFGNTRGKVADEGYRRDESEGFLSHYDETKYRAHQLALDRIGKGAPIVIVQPGAIYGRGDQSEVGNIIDQTRTGKMRMYMFPEFALNYVYVDDLADGIVLAHDRGRIGEAYILGGQMATMKELVDTVAELSGRKPPRRAMPVAAIKAGVPFGPVVGKLMGFPPNLGELIRTSDGVQIAMTDEKARRELGYSPRGLREGLRETLADSRDEPVSAAAA